MLRSALALAAACCLSGIAPAQDISVSQIGINNNQESYKYWGTANSIRAYSIATTACNVGNVDVSWRDQIKKSPIIGGNLFRMTSEGLFEQMGYTFVKFSFCALDEGGNGCPGGCNANGDCNWLSPNCSDTYWAELNDGKLGGAKWEIDPVRGAWPSGNPTGPIGNATIRGRLQVLNSDLQDSGALYFAEAQYLSEHDHLAGNARNNYAWRPITIPSPNNIDNIGSTQMGDPAVYAWQANANDVLIHDIAVEDEGGSGIHGWMFVASRAVDLGGGLWRYQYAVQNGNSERSGQSFTVKLPCDGVNITDTYYHGVRHHSGSPYTNVDWSTNVSGTDITWSTVDFATNPNANAIRWGTTYTFAFTADRAPSAGQGNVGLFIPGTPTDLAAEVIAPGGLFNNYCSANPNSTGVPAQITGLGSPYISDNDLRFEVIDLPVNVFGYFLVSSSTGFVPNFGGSSGNLCLGSPLVRFSGDVLNSGGSGEMTFAVDYDNLPQNLVFSPGDTWNFQLWYRDGLDSNTSEGVTVSFCN